jgi:outer membrane biosynthesis protein TonB
VKNIISRVSLATLAIALGMISWGTPLHAQTTSSAPTDSQAPQPAPDMQAPASTPETTPQSTPNSQPETQQPPAPEVPSQSQAPSAQTSDQQTPDTTTAPPAAGSKSATPSDATATSDAQTFSGTVVKQGDKYMLQDDSGKTYDIDHQTDVAKFDGKRVRVQGTLDSTGKKIMVK